MWSKNNKEKNEKRVVTTTETRHITTSTQSLVVRKTYEERSRSVCIGEANALTNFGNSISLALPSTSVSKSTSAANLGTRLDAQPTTYSQYTPSNSININYQSPYRNTAAYSSFNRNVPNSTIRPSTLSASTGAAYRINHPSAVVPKSTVQPPTKLIVKKTGRFYDKLQIVPTYETHSKKRGEVLIINNIMFKGKGERQGAKVDHENLESVFKQMGFTVTLKKDLSTNKMMSIVKDFSKRSSLKSVDIAVVIVMSHGTKNQKIGGTEVFGLDDEGVLVDDLIECFNETQCKNMAEKPKIFIFQCCRGDNEQFIQSDAQRGPQKVPALTNALIAYSTLPGYVSHRDPETGTWYIRTLCEVFSQHAHEYHVEDLLKMVDVKIGSITKHIKQTTHYENRGFKRCYLHPI